MIKGLPSRAQVSPFLAMDVMRRAGELENAGHNICHMEVGQPGHSLPDEVSAKIADAIGSSYLGYTNANGTDRLKAGLQSYYKSYYGLDIDQSRIIVTTGSSAGFMLAFLATVSQGQNLAMPVPGYPAYRNILTALNINRVDLRIGAQSGWKPSLDEIERVHGDVELNGLLLASPNNPTGTMLTADDVESISKYCTENGIWFFSDEIYHQLSFGCTEVTAARFGGSTIVINSFSKYFGMTGWRIGWLVVPDELVRPIECLSQSLYISPPTISQIAAAIALEHQDLFQDRRDFYLKNRAILTAALDEIEIPYSPADGAFYIYMDISQFNIPSIEFSQRLLEEYDVASTPGVDFDEQEGLHFVRLSYAGSENTIIRAAERIREFCAQFNV